MLTRRNALLGLGGAVALPLSGCGAMFDNQLFAGLMPAEKRSGRTLSRPNYADVYAKYPGEPLSGECLCLHLRGPDLPAAGGGVSRAGGTGHDRRGHVGAAALLVEPGGRATRYGVGVGREGFAWSGAAQINMHRSWPDWVPPKEMVERDPDVKVQLVATSRGAGVPGGPRNPLGARAMYLFTADGDTGYRIHGTTEPETVGTNGLVGLRSADQPGHDPPVRSRPGWDEGDRPAGVVQALPSPGPCSPSASTRSRTSTATASPTPALAINPRTSSHAASMLLPWLPPGILMNRLGDAARA